MAAKRSIKPSDGALVQLEELLNRKGQNTAACLMPREGTRAIVPARRQVCNEKQPFGPESDATATAADEHSITTCGFSQRTTGMENSIRPVTAMERHVPRTAPGLTRRPLCRLSFLEAGICGLDSKALE